MCNYIHCKTALKKYGYCVQCGEEICKDCASNDNSKVHAKCKDKTPTPIPYPCMPPEPEEILRK